MPNTEEVLDEIGVVELELDEEFIFEEDGHTFKISVKEDDTGFFTLSSGQKRIRGDISYCHGGVCMTEMTMFLTVDYLQNQVVKTVSANHQVRRNWNAGMDVTPIGNTIHEVRLGNGFASGVFQFSPQWGTNYTRTLNMNANVSTYKIYFS
ncbi:hypothetical protein AB3N04_00955 (plasmid) [Alkalihalophilus sp. As8PL]|uniref:Uncharacterized protein n=1 Tax=Alkalihalophilus sp. As8PL TaxID=3237103 RepID=A0AB39BNN2_9BACI